MTRRPMRRLSEVLPEVVAALGITDELATAGRERSWEAIIADLVPAATGHCEVVSHSSAELVVRASDAATAQELRLHGSAILAALPTDATGARPTDLRVVVRPPRGSVSSPS